LILATQFVRIAARLAGSIGGADRPGVAHLILAAPIAHLTAIVAQTIGSAGAEKH
jgi:hypothetical protein